MKKWPGNRRPRGVGVQTEWVEILEDGRNSVIVGSFPGPVSPGNVTGAQINQQIIRGRCPSPTGYRLPGALVKPRQGNGSVGPEVGGGPENGVQAMCRGKWFHTPRFSFVGFIHFNWDQIETGKAGAATPSTQSAAPGSTSSITQKNGGGRIRDRKNGRKKPPPHQSTI